MTTQSLDLTAGTAHVGLLPGLGGSISAFTLGEQAVLRSTPDEALAGSNVRLTSSYPLVPYSNRIREACLVFEGRRMPLIRNFGASPHAIHGVGWQRAWTVRAATSTRAMLTLEHRAQGDDASAWPWPFRAVQGFDLVSIDARHALLTATLTIENVGAAAFPFGLGWHPFFPRDSTTTLQFSAAGVWINDASEMPAERLDAIDDWSFKAPRTFGDATIDNLFTGWNGTVTLGSAEQGLVTTIEADSACDRLVVYAPAGRDFVAVEPVTHETDAFNRAAMGAQGTDMRVLAPGAAYSCTMRIAASIL
ncbi:MAG TPA: aldose 1-epimerase [Casimicrobiaceae bacterium]